jgi:hypothetical protein
MAMSTKFSVLEAEMEERRRRHPTLFEVRRLPGFGPFLSRHYPGLPPEVVAQAWDAVYPGWWQSRAVGRIEFDLVGFGPEPSSEVLADWSALEARFHEVVSACTEAVGRLAACTSENDLGRDRRGYLSAIRAALGSGTLGVSRIDLTGGGEARVALEFFGCDDCYRVPLVELKDLQVIGCLWSE